MFSSDKQADSTSAQFRFDSVDENASGTSKQPIFLFVIKSLYFRKFPMLSWWK
jgi:hypothetical protein